MRHLLVTLALVLSCAAAQAQHPQCQPPDVVVEGIAASHPVEKMIVLDPEQAARVGAWFDAQPPESELHFDFAVVLKHVNGQFGLLLGKKEKVCKAVLIPDELMPALLAAIMGTSAGLPLILVQEHHSGHPSEGELYTKLDKSLAPPSDF